MEITSKFPSATTFVDARGNMVSIQPIAEVEEKSIFTCKYNGSTNAILKIAHQKYGMKEMTILCYLHATQKTNFIPFLKLITAVKLGINQPLWLILEQGQLDAYNMIRQNPQLSMAEKVAYCFQMLQCVVEIHNRRVFHCDIALENFVLNNANELKLIDWECARQQISQEDLMINVVGQPDEYDAYEFRQEYTHPFVAQKKEIGLGRMDYYCLSVCFWAMMYGKLPYEETDSHGKQLFADNKFDFVSNPRFADFISKLHHVNVFQNRMELLQHDFFAH